MAASDHLGRQFTLHYNKTKVFSVEEHRVEARKKGRVIGELEVGPTPSRKYNIVDEINVAKKHRRQGVATAMLQHMKDQGVEFRHSRSRTPEGDAFAKATSKIVPTPKLRQKVGSDESSPRVRRHF